MTLLAFTTIYGFGAAVIAIVALFAAVFTKRAASVLSVIAAIAGGMAVSALVVALIIEGITS